AYAMVNRQDAPYSHGSPKLGRGLLSAEIIFDGTKLALEGSRPKTTTDGMNCRFQLYSISQNCARRTLNDSRGGPQMADQTKDSDRARQADQAKHHARHPDHENFL